MQRAARTNLILLTVAALLGIAVYLQVGHEVDRFEPPLSTLDADAIQTVRVGCLQCVTRHFERVAGHWQMREPYDLPADDTQVARLLAIATSPVRRRHALDAFEMARIGLDPPLMTLDLDAIHFDIGTADAFNGDRYVRTRDAIAMVPDRFSPFLAASPASELDRHLLPRGSTLVSLRIDGIEHAELITTWAQVQASRISLRTQAGTSTTNGRVELQLADGSLIHYVLNRSADGMVADRLAPPLRYALDAGQAQALLGDAEPPTP